MKDEQVYEKSVEKIYKCIIIALLFLVFVFGGTTIFYSKKSNDSGRLSNQLRERITDATNSNERLTDTVERCQLIISELDKSTERSIGTIREAVKIIEETREAVNRLEMVLANRNPDGIHGGNDNYVFNNE